MRGGEGGNTSIENKKLNQYVFLYKTGAKTIIIDGDVRVNNQDV